MDAPAQKICTICGLDCSNKPRTKDAQGRYVCKECMQRAQAAQLAKQDAANPKPAEAAAVAAPKAAGDQGDNAFILDIVEAPEVREGQKPCPSCGKGVSEGQILCTSCGFNMKTGDRTLINVLKPVELRDKTERNRGGGGGGQIPTWVPGVAALLVIGGLIVYGVSTEDAQMTQVALSLLSLFGMVTSITILVLAFMDSAMTGILILVTCGLYGLYWVFVKSENGYIKSMYAAYILLFLFAVLMLAASPEMLAQLKAK